MAEKINTEDSSSNNMIKLALLVVLGLLVASVLLKWLAALAIPILLFINRDWVFKIIAKIKELYLQNPIYGLGATIMAFVLLTPFSVVLFFRTIYNIFVLGKNPIPNKKEMVSMVSNAKKGIGKMKIEDNDGLMTIEEIRAKFKDDFE